MKKFFFLIICLILCGCSNNIRLTLTTSTISDINYNNITILNNDYEEIINTINTSVFYELLDNEIKGNPLIIKTSEYTYNFEVINNYLIYKINNKKYFTSTTNLSKYLVNTMDKYQNNDFYTVNLFEDYNINDSDYLFTVDNGNKYIIINSSLNIYNLQISKINEDEVNIELLNTVERIENNHIICIKTNNPQDIKISFDTPYNYNINITYKDEFIKNIETK